MGEVLREGLDSLMAEVLEFFDKGSMGMRGSGSRHRGRIDIGGTRGRPPSRTRNMFGSFGGSGASGCARGSAFGGA